MLPRAARMRASAQFRSAVRSGVRAGRSHLVVHASRGDGPTEIGFVVSRQVGPAVVRNRVKRRLRHLAAARLDAVAPGTRVVVRALPAAAAASSAELAHDLDSALATVGRRLVDA